MKAKPNPAHTALAFLACPDVLKAIAPQAKFVRRYVQSTRLPAQTDVYVDLDSDYAERRRPEPPRAKRCSAKEGRGPVPSISYLRDARPPC
jgi:hypothetical protein